MTERRGWAGILSRVLDVVSSATRGADSAPTGTRAPKARLRTDAAAPGPRRTPAAPAGRGAASESVTVEVAPPARGGLRIEYTPRPDGDPDAGEVVWTWVPYEENDGRGKDRPVLIIGRHTADRVYAVRLTSKAHDGSRDFLSIGSGEWDPAGRPSWVDVEQIYSVHEAGMRREAAALDPARFLRVAQALHNRYGWTIAV